ncbi:MAG: double zinc ribbon domain-containing protein [Syntrophobacteria bacterium]
MKCPACGTVNKANAGYCKVCGAKLGVGECSECGAAIEPDALYCSVCGARLPSRGGASGKTCQSCGFVNTIGTTYCKRCNQKIL